MSGSPAGRRHASHDAARPWWQWVAMVVAGALGFMAVYAQTVTAQIDSAIDARSVDSIVSQRPVKPTDEISGDALNILFIGSDDRSGVNGEISGKVAGMRNDATILMHLPADRSRVDMVSIPRDAQVTIPDCTLFDGTPVPGGTGDFNVAFSNGARQGDTAEAAACVINTVEDLTGIYIDHYAVIDFNGFKKMVNALDGVPMCITTKIDSKDADLHVEAGPQVLNGAQALGYARLRTAETGEGVSGSDLQRVTRQQQLLNQMSATVLSKNLLTDAPDLTQFVRATAESMTMDPVLGDSKYLLGLAYSLRGIGRSDVTFATVPWKYTADFNDVVLLPEAEQTWEQLRTDTPLTTMAEETNSSSWDDGLSDTAPEEPAKPDHSVAPEPTSSTPGDAENVNKALLDECAT